MLGFIKIKKFFVHSYKRFGILLFLITTLISIPFTYGVFNQRQEIRQYAMQAQIAEGDISGDISGGGNNPGLPQGISCAAAGCYDANGNPYYGSQQSQTNPYNPYQQQQQQYPQQQQTPQTQTQTQQPQAVAASGGGSCPAAHAGLDAEEKTMIGLINSYRQQHGLSTLGISGMLNTMSSNLSEDMAISGNLSHTDSQGRDFTARTQACGFPSSLTNTPNYAGENAGASSSNAQAQFNGWLSSPHHLENIVNPGWTTMGIGRAFNTAQNNWYWTNGFAVGNPGGTVTDDNTIVPTNTPIPTNTPVPTGTTTPVVTVPQATIITPPITTIILPTSTITSTPSATPIPATGSASFAISFKMPGISSKNGYLVDRQISGEIEIKRGETLISNETYQFIFDPQTSTFTTHTSPTLGAGTYNIRIRTTNSLWKKLEPAIITQNQITQAPTTTLIVGDLNSDNVLNLTDYTLLLSCLDPKSCMGKLNADLNKDGKVNSRDLNIFYLGINSRQGD